MGRSVAFPVPGTRPSERRVSGGGSCPIWDTRVYQPVHPRAAGEQAGATTRAGTLDLQLPVGEHRVEPRRRGFLELLAREFLPRKGT